MLIETAYYKSKVYVPAKCVRCPNLKLETVRGFICNLDRERWGAFPRSLDWGSWSPEHPNLGLQSGRSVTHEVIQAVAEGSEVRAIKAFRAAHPDATFREARDAYAELLAQLRQHGG